VTAIRMGWRMRLFCDRQYRRFRMVTMYGDAESQARAEDLIVYLRWCKAWEQAKRSQR